MNKNEFQSLIKKYLDGDISAKDLKRLVNYYESFQEDTEWVEELESEDTLKSKMLTNILESVETNNYKIKTIPLYKRSVFKYALVACLGLFLMLNSLYDNTYYNLTTPIQVEDAIEIGSTKATLTLSNGTDVVLKYGKKYKSNIAQSDDNGLVYNPAFEKGSEITYNYVTVPRGGEFYVKLEDGTKVWLNSESKLKYPTSFVPGKTRTIELLYGEAYFDVSPSSAHEGASFKVLKDKQEITVLGTQFNLKAYEDEDTIYTTLVEGKVNVQVDAQQITLSPKEQAVVHFDSSKIQVNDVDVYSAIAWKKGIFSFKNMPLEEIMKVLARWYDIEVIFKNPSVSNSSFDGVLRKNQHIEAILESIKITNGINYEIEKNKVIFK